MFLEDAESLCVGGRNENNVSAVEGEGNGKLSTEEGHGSAGPFSWSVPPLLKGAVPVVALGEWRETSYLLEYGDCRKEKWHDEGMRAPVLLRRGQSCARTRPDGALEGIDARQAVLREGRMAGDGWQL